MNIKQQMQRAEQFFKQCEELRPADVVANRVIDEAVKQDIQQAHELFKNPTVRPVNIKRMPNSS